MILPTKRLSEPRSLLGMGAIILGEISKPKDLSRLWEDTKRAYSEGSNESAGPQTFTYEWFVLALDFLYLIEAVAIEDGRVRKLKFSAQVREIVPRSQVEPVRSTRDIATTSNVTSGRPDASAGSPDTWRQASLFEQDVPDALEPLEQGR